MALVGADLAVLLELLEVIGRVPPEVADLDPRLLHALVDLAHEVVPPLLGERRDVQPDDGAVDVRREADVALGDRALDRPEDAAVPGLDDDLVRLGDADPGELVERRLGAVVVDVDPLDEAGRCAAGPDRLQVAVHDLDGARHLVVGGR